jgi:hypothetical protein
LVDLVGANINRNDYSINCCLLNYNKIMYCHVYNFLDFLTSLKNKLEVFQCFQLHKLENTKINDNENTFKLFVLGKNCVVYFCILNDKQLFIINTNNKMGLLKLMDRKIKPSNIILKANLVVLQTYLIMNLIFVIY